MTKWTLMSRLLGATMFLTMGVGCALSTYNMVADFGLRGPAPLFCAMMMCLTLACSAGVVQILRGEWD